MSNFSFSGFPLDSQWYLNTSTNIVHRESIPIPSEDHSYIRKPVNRSPSATTVISEFPKDVNEPNLFCPPPPFVDIGFTKCTPDHEVELDSDEELVMIDPLEITRNHEEAEDEPEVTLSDLLTLNPFKRKKHNKVPEEHRDAAYYAMREKNTSQARKSRQKKRKIDACRVALIQELSDKVDKLTAELGAEKEKVLLLEQENSALKTENVGYYFIPTSAQRF